MVRNRRFIANPSFADSNVDGSERMVMHSVILIRDDFHFVKQSSF
jgi:hypothetical protein